MTLTAILTRHAKSSWANDTLGDHERPLNKRGVRSGRAIGKWLNDRGHIPGECLCSTAVRACSTAELIKRALPPMKERKRADLYHASAVDILEALREATEPVVLLVGHNPGMLYAAHGLVQAWPAHPAFEDYPTAATTVITFEAECWADIDWKQGRAVDFVIPRELIPQDG